MTLVVSGWYGIRWLPLTPCLMAGAAVLLRVNTPPSDMARWHDDDARGDSDDTPRPTMTIGRRPRGNGALIGPESPGFGRKMTRNNCAQVDPNVFSGSLTQNRELLR